MRACEAEILDGLTRFVLQPPPMDLREQLQSSLGSAYTLDRELGGGAMSRVFVARDVALGRDVVVKLLSPELSGAVSADRFQREIALVARLWERLGDTRHAYDATRRVQFNSGLPPYVVTYARERARLAASLGEREDAIKQYRVYVSARARPDSALRGDLDRAKRELARLEKMPSGRN